MNPHDVIKGEAQFIVPTYPRPDIVFSHGSGAYLFDTEGRRYLDFAYKRVDYWIKKQKELGINSIGGGQ